MSDNFTPNQVAAILEKIEGQFRAVSEVVFPLREDMTEVKDRLTKVENRLISVEDALRIAIPHLSQRVTRLESKPKF